MENSSTISDGKCEYREYNRKCPLPGSVSNATRKGGRWFCSGHSFYPNGKEAQNILDFNISHYKLILHNRNCKKLFCDECKEYEIAKSNMNKNDLYY